MPTSTTADQIRQLNLNLAILRHFVSACQVLKPSPSALQMYVESWADKILSETNSDNYTAAPAPVLGDGSTNSTG